LKQVFKTIVGGWSHGGSTTLGRFHILFFTSLVLMQNAKTLGPEKKIIITLKRVAGNEWYPLYLIQI